MTEGLALLNAGYDWAVLKVPGGEAAIWAGILVVVGVGALYYAFRKFKAR